MYNGLVVQHVCACAVRLVLLGEEWKRGKKVFG